jgi:hypothetical protein
MEITSNENVIRIAHTIKPYRVLVINGIFIDNYSKIYIEINLIDRGEIHRGYAAEFEIFHPIKFGNWGLVGFILDRLHKTDMAKNNQYFNDFYNQWFSTEKLISDATAEMSYQEFLGY